MGFQSNTTLYDRLYETKYGNALIEVNCPMVYADIIEEVLATERDLNWHAMWKKKFPIPSIFYLYKFLTYASSVVIITMLIIAPLTGNLIGTLWFLAGTFYIGFLQGLNLWSFGYDSKAIVYENYLCLCQPSCQ